MATLEKIRNRGVLLVTIIALALFAFIIGDFLNSGATFFGQSRANVLEVNGESVKIDEFQEKVDEFTNVYQLTTGDTQSSEDFTAQVRENVFESLVREKLINNEAEQLGLTVTGKELFDLTAGENTHPVIEQNLGGFFRNPQTGEFDKEAFRSFLKLVTDENSDLSKSREGQAYKQLWMFWENRLKTGVLEDKINSIFTKAVLVNDLEAEMGYKRNGTATDLAYVLRPYASIADSTLTVSNAELSAAYKKHKENFKQEDARDITYIVVPVTPSEDDYAQAEEWIEKQREEFATTNDVEGQLNEVSDVPYLPYRMTRDEVPAALREFAFNGHTGDVTTVLRAGDTYRVGRILSEKRLAPDSAQVNLLLATRATEAESQALADSLVKALAGGADFEALTEKYPGQALGWVKEAQLEREMIAPVFYGNGSVFAVKTVNGTYVMQVTGRTKPVEKVHLAILERTVEPSSATYGTIYNEVKAYTAKNKTAEAFKANADSAGYALRVFTKMGENVQKIASLPDSRKIVRWVFEAKKGEISDVFECENDFVVAVLDGIYEKGYLSEKDAKEQLTQIVRRDKKVEALTAELGAKGKDLEAIAAGYQTTVDTLRAVNFAQPRTAIGFEPAVIGAAVNLKEGEVSKPVAGQNGVFLLQAVKKIENEGAIDLEAEKAQQGLKYNYIIPQGLFKYLRDEAQVEDTRARFY